MLSLIYKRSMVVGDYVNRFVDSQVTSEWSASEECATFAKLVYKLTETLNIGDLAAMDKVLNTIQTYGFRNVEDHMWDDYCRGFIAGQWLGLPTADNLKIAEEVERLWREDNSGEFGYYQEAMNEVTKYKS